MSVYNTCKCKCELIWTGHLVFYNKFPTKTMKHLSKDFWGNWWAPTSNKWTETHSEIYYHFFIAIFFVCFQWNKHTNINYWKYHAKTILYPYYIIAIVTSSSKRVHLGVHNWMWKCAICRILLWCRMHTFTANYVHPSGPFCFVRSQLYSVVLSWVLKNKLS